MCDSIDNNELKINPCPFCNSNNLELYSCKNLYTCDEYSIVCCDCNASSGNKQNKEEVIKSWNKAYFIKFTMDEFVSLAISLPMIVKEINDEC